MCDACEHGIEAARAMEEKMIAEVGYSIRFIGGGVKDSDPAFMHTVGRAPKAPELYINSLAPRNAAELMASAIQSIDDGDLAVVDGLVTDRLLMNNYRVKFVACEPRAALMLGAIERNQYYAPETFQILWPDAAGLLQGEDGFDEQYRQPTYPLDVERMYAEYDETHSPVPSTAVCTKHAHRGQEFSAATSITRHLPSDDATLMCQICGKGNTCET